MKSPKKNFILKKENLEIYDSLENKSEFINYCLSKVLTSSKLQEFLKDGTVLNIPKSKKSISIEYKEDDKHKEIFTKQTVLKETNLKEIEKIQKPITQKTIKNEESINEINTNQETTNLDTSGFDEFGL